MTKTLPADHFNSLCDIVEFLSNLADASPDDVWGRMTERLAAELGADAGTYYAFLPQKHHLVPRRVLGVAAAEVGTTPVDTRTGICGWVAEHRQPVLIANAYEDYRFLGDVDRLTGFKTKTVLAVPLLDRLELLGVLELFNKRAGPFTDRDLHLTEAACRAAATALRTLKNAPSRDGR